jgi:hypothetical protein
MFTKKCEYCDEIHKDNNTGCSNSGNCNSGDCNSGYCNSGNRNSGDCNSGYCNSGNRNSGNYNSGNYNSGYRNSGYYNSGYYNSGNYNSGNYNSGNYNSGNYNSGYRNSGYYNSGYYNSGWFNTNEPKMRFFNKDSDVTYSEFSKNRIVYPALKICAWVDLNDLPKSEQSESAKQMGGLLKTLTYKEAWAEYWNRASEEDKKWFENLPNFDATIFEEITGIKVNAPQSLSGKEVEVKLDGVTYKAIIK